MRYERILAEVLNAPWAVHPGMLTTITEILIRRIRGDRLSAEEIASRISAGQERTAVRGAGARVGTVAVMPVLGVMIPRAEALERTSGAISTQELTAHFDRLVADPAVSAIVLDFDSPGGSAGGVEEFAMRVSDATAKKPVVAIANPMMASAAYWVGSQASELLVTPSALVGSVGVYAAHEDISAMLEQEGVKVTLVSAGAKKVLGNPFEPLSDEGRVEIRKRVDEFYGMFVKAVARGRGVAQRDVREGFGQGGVVGAAEAIELRMADKVGVLDDAIALAAKRAGVKPGPRAEGDTAIFAGTGGAVDVAFTESRTMVREVRRYGADGGVDVERMVAPDEDGNCPEGYEMGEDGMCHMMSREKPSGAAFADAVRRFRLAGD